ncbi:dTDP-4-dehydrorhamnose reductase [Rhizobium sp. 2YAF20]|uniref:dTDP-4-dehydrorhamnose reductase n=1 Tax=Rhizobium sp. 2YAF20 TaxID=3233027 RepID=UPI003F9E2A53
MRLLLTGKNGQVGFELQRALGPLGDVIAVDHAACDLQDHGALRATIRRLKPNVIVNPAAYTAVDEAESEQDRAFAVNAVAPGILGEEAAELGALVVHYSTDYVFGGEDAGYYTEADEPDPQSAYGRSKLAGEIALQASTARHLIFRTSWVVGAHGGNFARTMLRLAAERDELKVVADQFGAPTSASLIADVTALLVRDAIRDPKAFRYGLYHLAAGGETNWHTYACHIIEAARRLNKQIRVAPTAICAISTAEYPARAKRPANSRLDTKKLRATFGLNLPHWQDGVDHVLQQMM